MNGNKNIILRAMEPDDIDTIYRWENDPSVWSVSAAHQPFSRAELQRFIDESKGSDIYTSRQLRLMADGDDGTVGCIDLFDFDPFHRRAALGVLVDRRLRHRGYATAMLQTLEAFAARHLALHQLHCIVASDNQHSISLFDKAGYAVCGRMQEWVLSDGRWIDALVLQKIIEL